MNIVIIGGSAAGHNTAINLKTKYKDAGITLITDEKFPFYDRKKLFDFWSGRSREKELFLSSQEFYSQQNINFLKESKVVAVNPARRSVSYKKDEKRSSLNYDFLVIASGAKTVRPDIAGINKSGVFCLDGLADFKELKDTLMTDAVCLIGANHLTSRVIENIIANQVEVKLVSDKAPENLPEQVELINSEVVEIIGESGAQAIKLKEGKIIAASWVGVMSEPVPSVDFLEGADIRKSGQAIAVDHQMRTSIVDIFACGAVCLQDGLNPRVKSWDDSLAESSVLVENILK
jgi:NAD(P)H-nitrite reductase large subunit